MGGEPFREALFGISASLEGRPDEAPEVVGFEHHGVLSLAQREREVEACIETVLRPVDRTLLGRRQAA